MTTFYWKSTCTSCRDARRVVRDAVRDAVREAVSGATSGATAVVTEREYSKKPLSEEEILAVVAAVGSVAAALNTRHEIAKANGWKASPPSPEVFAAAAAKENNLLRRPILIDGARSLVGFDAAAIAAFLQASS